MRTRSAAKKSREDAGVEAKTPASQSESEQYSEKLKKAGAGESKLKKLGIRLFFGGLLFALLIYILYSGHLYLCAAIVTIQFLLFRELSAVRFKEELAKQVPFFRTLMWCWFLSAMFYSFGNTLYRFQVFAPYEHYHGWVSFSMYVGCFVLSVLNLKKGYYKYQMGQMTWTLISVCLVVFQSRCATSNVFNGLFWFILPCFLIICNDTMAYFVGLAVGRKIIKYPFLTLSPNKTWEGFIGGALFTMALGFVMPCYMDSNWFICPLLDPFATELQCVPNRVFLYQDYTLPEWLAMALRRPTVRLMEVQLHAVLLATFASFIAPFGGFFASGIKRAYSIKDFDSIIPGHGGFMDRMDCQLLMALCVFVHYSTFIEDYTVTLPEVLSLVRQLSASDQEVLLQQLTAMRA